VNPVHRVHARWTGAGQAVHRGPTVAWTEGTVARSPALGLRPLRCTEAHRRGRNREREMWGTRLGPHRGSGGAEEAGRWRCRMGRRRRSVRGLLTRGEREIGVGEVQCCSGRVLAFYRGRGSAGEGWPGRLTPALMALTPLKMGRLDERLRSAIKEGNQGAG
jgi:hypothetical protein